MSIGFPPHKRDAHLERSEILKQAGAELCQAVDKFSYSFEQTRYFKYNTFSVRHTVGYTRSETHCIDYNNRIAGDFFPTFIVVLFSHSINDPDGRLFGK